MTGSASVVLLALALDIAVGDPPNRVHPVSWIGTLLAIGQRHLARGSWLRLRTAGAVLVVTVAFVAGAAGWVIADLTATLGVLGLVIQAIALKLMFAVRGLAKAALAVAGDLDRGDLKSARAAVGTDLVSRSTATLSAGNVASATIESVAENLTDSILAPLLFYAFFGLPGAAVYRAVNTADARIGYRTGVLDDFGKIAARLDDVLNLIPARLGALLLVVATALTRQNAVRAWTTMWREHGRTSSPNAGWTMAAMAGGLGVSLLKVDHYRVGDGREPTARDVRRSVRVMAVAAALSAGTVALLLHMLS
ncbi:MAG: cobalamin biosynthesis protein CobD [Candidatus Rokuibacteriota bacterium]|nr:MAG: cobalamin biosynthesis protein CobD [Candidatus Rokubacteria bacterium]